MIVEKPVRPRFDSDRASVCRVGLEGVVSFHGKAQFPALTVTDALGLRIQQRTSSPVYDSGARRSTGDPGHFNPRTCLTLSWVLYLPIDPLWEQVRTGNSLS